jgi:hypothetical protein
MAAMAAPIPGQPHSPPPFLFPRHRTVSLRVPALFPISGRPRHGIARGRTSADLRAAVGAAAGVVDMEAGQQAGRGAHPLHSPPAGGGGSMESGQGMTSGGS